MITDIFLREFDVERDLYFFHKVHSDSSSMQFYGMHEFNELEQSRALMNSYIDSESNGQSIHRVIADSTSNEYIGEIGIFNINSHHHRADAYCILRPENRRKGISFKASAIFYKKIFESLNINRIQAMVDSRNVDAIKSLKGLGFTHEGKLEQYEFCDGEYIDIESFALIKERFYYIVPWISYHEYIVDGTSKTLIYEQRSHIFYLLSDEASAIWKALVTSGFATDIDLSPISVLIEDGVIIYGGAKKLSQSTSSSHVNKFHKSPETFYEEIKSEGYIYDAHWDITNKCNEKCLHCYNSNAHNGQRNFVTSELSFQEAKLLVDELEYLGVFRLALSGGEVLTKDYLIPLCRYIREKNIQLIIYTNGFAFTQELLHEIASLYPSTICFSVYGNDELSHETVTRVKGSYNKVLFALEYFKSRQIETCHKNTALTVNYHCWLDTLKKGREISDCSLINCTIYPSMDDRQLSVYSLDEHQLTQMALSQDSPIYYRNKRVGACNIFKEQGESPCYNITNNIYINPAGEVGLCIAYPYVIASLRDGNMKALKRYKRNPTFIEDFRGLSHTDILDNWRSMKISDLKECGNYDYCKHCIDVCPGDAYLLTGDLLKAPANHCVIAKARHRAHMLEDDQLKTSSCFLSFVIPAYNREQTIGFCIDSILSQTSDIAFEIIVVDDHSTDNTVAMVRDIAGANNPERLKESNLAHILPVTASIFKDIEYKDEMAIRSRIRIIELDKRQGAANARNTGMEAAMGEYIWFVDSDDFIASGSLKIINKILHTHQLEILRFAKENHSSPPQGYYIPHSNNSLDIMNMCNIQDLLYMLRTGAVWCAIFKKDFIKEHRFDTRFSYSEDSLFTWQVTLQAHTGAYLNEALYGYMSTPESLTSIKPFDRFDCYISVVKGYIRAIQMSVRSDEDKQILMKECEKRLYLHAFHTYSYSEITPMMWNKWYEVYHEVMVNNSLRPKPERMLSKILWTIRINLLFIQVYKHILKSR